MACALPWLKEMDLNPVLAHPGGAVIADARVRDRPGAAGARRPRYRAHGDPPLSGASWRASSRSPTARRVRGAPDPARGRRSSSGASSTALSERSRYQRFMQHLRELPPPMLARFTQLDYDRELALVALDPAGSVRRGGALRAERRRPAPPNSR